MSRNIRCEKCNKDMGEIRDARLRSGIVYYCSECNKSIKAQVAAAKHLSKYGQKDVPDFLKGIFG